MCVKNFDLWQEMSNFAIHFAVNARIAAERPEWACPQGGKQNKTEKKIHKKHTTPSHHQK
jgi:hypothetical protein